MNMKKIINLFQIHSILAFVCITIVGSSSVTAQSISQRYAFNTNNWLGYIDININGDSLSGNALIHTDPNGKAVKYRFWLEATRVKYMGSHSIEITFRRSNSDQVYHGWFSVDRRLIAGYFEWNQGKDKCAWYAIRYPEPKLK